MYDFLFAIAKIDYDWHSREPEVLVFRPFRSIQLFFLFQIFTGTPIMSVPLWEVTTDAVSSSVGDVEMARVITVFE